MYGHNFATVTPIEVNPTPTSSSRRARSVPIIFTMVWHIENDHFSLVRKQPPPRENYFRQKNSAVVSHFFPEYLSTPRQANLLSWAPNLHVDFACTLCVCSCSCFISFSSAVISLCLSCMLVIHDTFAMLIRMLLLIMPCHYSTLFACHHYKMLWGL